jgi:hypothetical protein
MQKRMKYQADKNMQERTFTVGVPCKDRKDSSLDTQYWQSPAAKYCRKGTYCRNSKAIWLP